MKRSRVLIALLSLSAALAAASASFSIAWYASSTHLRVEEIVIEADATRSLTIATEIDGEYKSDLHPQDLKAVGHFAPVTTAFTENWLGQSDMPKFYDMSHPHFTENDPRLYEGSPSGYFSQELFLKCDDDAIVGIDAEGSTFTPDKAKNNAYARKLALEEGLVEGSEAYEEFLTYTANRLNLIHQAGRISVLVDDQYLVYDPIANEEGPVYLAGTLDNDCDKVYETYSRSDTGDLFEVCYGQLSEGHTRADLPYFAPGGEYPEVIEYNAFDADHDPFAHVLDFESAKEMFATENRLTKAELGSQLQMPQFHFDMAAHTPKRVVVSFYLEGWDRDSVNYVMGASFDLTLSFRIIREK